MEEDWALQKNTDGTPSAAIDNDLIDGPQFLWRFQGMDSFGLGNNQGSTSNPNNSMESNEMTDDLFQEEVNRLFLQSLAMQQQQEQQQERQPQQQPHQPVSLQPAQPQQHGRPSLPQDTRMPSTYISHPSYDDIQHYVTSDFNTHGKRPTSAQQDEKEERPKIRLRLTVGENGVLNAPTYAPSVPSKEPTRQVPVRPSLRIHLMKDELEIDQNRDPMMHELDLVHLQRLTAATLRTLRYSITIDELPEVDIDSRLETDSHQVLPREAMDILSVMALGTSGDKDVTQTVGSQISNGDLVALQRMILAALRSKNIVIHGTLPQRQPESKTSSSEHVFTHRDGEYDLSRVQYGPPTMVTRLFLRLYRYVINGLHSSPDCWPFIQPVPESAHLYHQEIKKPMDLATIELNVWKGRYTSFARFEKDIQLIWKNARIFHRNAGTIPKHADNLEQLFYKVVRDMKKQLRKLPVTQTKFRFDTSHSLPEESDFTYPPLSQIFSKQSIVYSIAAMSPFEPKSRTTKGLTTEKSLYLQLNGPFFQAVERMKQDPTGSHDIIPRLYISKNRTLLEQVRSHGVLAIFFNTTSSRTGSKRYTVETSMLLTYPASELFHIAQGTIGASEYAPKGWIHLRPLRLVEHVTFQVNEVIERDYFRRMFATSKLLADEKNIHFTEETRQLLKAMVTRILDLPEGENPNTPQTATNADGKQDGSVPGVGELAKTDTTTPTPTGKKDPSTSKRTTAGRPVKPKNTSPNDVDSINQRLGIPEMSHEVWKRLFEVCRGRGIDIAHVNEKYRNINWNAPDSEGFFKKVYFTNDIVVQTFRQMTMYQRITEVACLMKLKELPHMAQLKDILYNDQGDICGLSIERYQTTLKQYSHVHSHYRLSCHQKYEIIYQLLGCMKTIHEAGLAHRDLSEVNIMVNEIEGQLDDGSPKICLYLIDFGKAVFCHEQDVREWFVDVPRANWEYDGDIVPETKEELDAWCEALPWVKGKPDHGYPMYRSIQTLPRKRSDKQVLPWLIHPQSEDIYSMGVIIWKVFTETEPWRGTLDTDLKALRYAVEDDYRIQKALESEVHGELSRQLLLKCLKTMPQERATAAELLDWITENDTREGLLNEWKMYSSETRSARKAKMLYGFEDKDEDDKKRKNRKPSQVGEPSSNGPSQGRGRPRKDPVAEDSDIQHQASVLSPTASGPLHVPAHATPVSPVPVSGSPFFCPVLPTMAYTETDPLSHASLAQTTPTAASHYNDYTVSPQHPPGV